MRLIWLLCITLLTSSNALATNNVSENLFGKLVVGLIETSDPKAVEKFKRLYFGYDYDNAFKLIWLELQNCDLKCDVYYQKQNQKILMSNQVDLTDNMANGLFEKELAGLILDGEYKHLYKSTHKADLYERRLHGQFIHDFQFPYMMFVYYENLQTWLQARFSMLTTEYNIEDYKKDYNGLTKNAPSDDKYVQYWKSIMNFLD